MYVVDREPFSMPMISDEDLEVLVQMQARNQGIDRERIEVHRAEIGNQYPEVPEVTQAYFFFPNPAMF